MRDSGILARLFLLLLRILFGAPRGNREPDAIARVLVIRIDERLGDLLLTTPLFRALARALPAGGRVEALVSARYTHVLQGNPHLAAIHAFRKRDLFKHPLRYLGLLKRLRRVNFDVVIDASHPQVLSRTSAALAYAVGAPIRVGHDRGAARLFLNKVVPVLQPVDEIRESDHKRSLLGPLGIEPASSRTEYHALENSPAEREQALSLIASLRGEATGPVVAIFPGGRKAVQRWPTNRFATVGRTLVEKHGARCIVAWGPGEQELAHTVAERIPMSQVAPTTNVLELAAIFEVCDAVLTNDTGPMHLAVAVGAPTCAVFTTGVGARYGPRGVHNRTVDGNGSLPGPQQVLDAMIAILALRDRSED